MVAEIAMPAAKRKLATTWFVAVVPIFLLVFARTILGSPDSAAATQLWSWFLPTVLPTLSLIVGVLVEDFLVEGKKTRAADPYLFRLARTMSLAYIALVLLTFALAPLSKLGEADVLTLSHLWLSPLQGLVAAVLAAFFVKKEETAAEDVPAGGTPHPAEAKPGPA